MKPLKISSEALKLYLLAHPDATYVDLEKEFKVSQKSMYWTLKRFRLPLARPSRFGYPRDKIRAYVSAHPDFSYSDLEKVFGGTRDGFARVLTELKLPHPQPIHYKYNRDDIESYLLDHPMAGYDELARIFKGTPKGIYQALIRFGLVDIQRRPSIKYHKDELEKWIKAHPEGTYKQIARAFKSTPTNIFSVLRRLKLTPLKPAHYKMRPDLLKDYLSSYPGARDVDIAEKFKCGLNQVRIVLRKQDLQWRSTSRRYIEKYRCADVARYMIDHPDATYADLMKDFKISLGTLQALLKRCGLPRLKSVRIKYHRDSLERYLMDHPDATAKEIAEHFKGSKRALFRAFKRYGLKLKHSRMRSSSTLK